MMNFKARPASALLAVLLASSCLPACSPVTAEAAGPTQLDEAARAVILGREGEEAFWWLHVTEQAGTRAWFGPHLEDDEGRVWRYWVMTSSFPGGTLPWSSFQGTLLIESADPVGITGEDFNIQLRPQNGLTWGDVRGVADLQQELEGF